MAQIVVKNSEIKTIKINDIDYICITDIAKQKNPLEPKDVVKNWLRSKNTLGQRSRLAKYSGNFFQNICKKGRGKGDKKGVKGELKGS